jgi:hypothetical protein
LKRPEGRAPNCLRVKKLVNILDSRSGVAKGFQRFLFRLCCGMEGAANQGVDITANKINEWVQVDRRRKIRADRRDQFFGRVRKTFIYLFIATILVVALNHYTEIQSLAYAQLVCVAKKVPGSEKLRQSAVNYENQVAEIAK